MIILVDGGPGSNRPATHIGRLVTPRSGSVIKAGERWAMDNDAYGAWSADRFARCLLRYQGIPGCLFVSCPDVVGDFAATLSRFWEWRGEIAGSGYPVAFVVQDGARPDLIPWDFLDAVFVGGSAGLVEWKLSEDAARVVEAAKARGKWAHMGRVNSSKRLQIAYDFGCDSVDGSGFSKFPDAMLRRCMPTLKRLNRERLLF